MKIEQLTQDRSLTIVRGTGIIGDPATYATACALAHEASRRPGNKALKVCILSPDPWAATWWVGLLGADIDNMHHASHPLAVMSTDRDVWAAGIGAHVGTEYGHLVKARAPDHLIVIDHPDVDPTRWAWARRLSGAKHTTVFSSQPSSDAEGGWRIFRGDAAAKADEKTTLATAITAHSTNGSHHLTVRATSFKPDSGGFATDRPHRAKAEWRTGATVPDVSAWRDAVEQVQAEEEQRDAIRWLDEVRPAESDIPAALLNAAPWLASKK